jgi:hypothetical protein
MFSDQRQRELDRFGDTARLPILVHFSISPTSERHEDRSPDEIVKSRASFRLSRTVSFLLQISSEQYDKRDPEYQGRACLSIFEA